jgi:hypothetical protein
MKNKNLAEATYIGLVELFIKNGYLNHASYFLCRMDRLKIKIPRNLLDLFVDFFTKSKIYENMGEIKIKKEDDEFKNNKYVNKYDKYDVETQDPDYEYYFNKRNNFTKRNMMNVFSTLNIEAKPFFPKNAEKEENSYDQIKTKLSEIDPNKVKEFIPKNYRVVKKEI